MEPRHLEFVIHSRRAIESAAMPVVPYVVLSITTSPTDEARIPPSPHCLGVLRLAFFDSDLSAEDEGPEGLFSRDDARQIWRFLLPLHKKLRCIVLHCSAGVSRSPGVAAALSNVLCGDDQSFFERYRPNRRVYTLLLDVFANEFSLTDA